MRVILAHKFFNYNGGADVFFFEVGRVLEEKGHQVAYFSTKDDNNLNSIFSKYFVKPPNFKDGGVIKKMKEFCKIPYNLESKKNFTKLIDDFNPDIIHVFNIITQISPSILDVAKRKGIPIVISLNDYKHICPNYKLFHHGKICEDCKGGKFYKAITNKCSHESMSYSLASSIESYIHSWLNIYKKNIDLFLFASDFMAHKTIEFWGDNFKWGKLLNPFKIPNKSALNNKGAYGLYFGRLIDEKGVDVLIEALKLTPQVPFKIVGDGPDFEKLINIAKLNNLHHVEFTGAIWGEQLEKIIENSKFVVVPSIWHENFPYVVLQAFAASKPVIGSNRGGIPELVKENERGTVYNPMDSVELANKINSYYNDDELCYQLGQNARKYIEDNFNDEVFYNQLINNYKKVLK